MSKKKKVAAKQVVQPTSPKNLIIQRGRTYPIVECRITEKWQAMGECTIVIFRKMGGDKYAMGMYLVDLFCLGLKDTGYRIMADYEKEEIVKELKNDGNYQAVDSTLAQNIIYGAVEYAEDLGFKPHKDFSVSQYLLDDVEELEYVEVAFGVDGKPMFIPGQYDNVGLILNTLNKSVGEGNYIYQEGEEEYPGNEALDELDEAELEIWEEMEEEDKMAYLIDYKLAALIEDYGYDYTMSEEQKEEVLQDFLTVPEGKEALSNEANEEFKEIIQERMKILLELQATSMTKVEGEDETEEEDIYPLTDVAIDIHFYHKKMQEMISPEILEAFQTMSEEERTELVTELVNGMKEPGSNIEEVEFEEVKENE